MKQVTGPIVSTTLVLIAVFVPVAFLPGIAGQLYRQFAVTITASVTVSALNALTLSPALCAIMLRPPTAARGPVQMVQSRRSIARATAIRASPACWPGVRCWPAASWCWWAAPFT